MTNSQRRGLILDLDLNYPPSSQNWTLDGLSLGLSIYTNSQEVQDEIRGRSHYQTANNVVALDDEVAIISSQTFAEATGNFKRIYSQRMDDRPSEATGSSRSRTGETNFCPDCRRIPAVDQHPHLKAETSNKAMTFCKSQELSQPVQVPEEPIFCCPICLGELIEPTTTKCGHIFCKECLLKSLKSLQSKCPTCRQKVGKRSIFRVYLPTNY